MIRDPRQDPRPGDVVRAETPIGWVVLVVTDVSDASVSYGVTHSVRGGAGRTSTHRVSRPVWRGSAKRATVLHPLGVTYDGSPALADDLSDGRRSGR